MLNKKSFFCLTFLITFPLSIFSQVKIESPVDAVNIGIQFAEEYKIQHEQSLIGLQIAKYSITPFLPSLSLDFGNTDSIKKYSTDTRSKSFSFGIKQLVFNGGKTILSYQMGQISARQQYEKYENNLKQYSVEVINSYFSYLTTLDQLEAQRDLLNNAQEEYKIMQAEYKYGLILESDLLEYEIRIMGHTDNLKKTERQVQTQLRSLKYLLGLTPQIDIDISYTDDFDLNNEFYLEEYSDFLWRLADLKNLELKQLKQSLDLSKKQLKYQQALYIPSISFETNFAVSGVHYPLTEPSFTLKFNIAFDSNPFLPLNYSNGYGIEDDRINKISHNANTTLSAQPTYFASRKLQNLSMVESINNLKLKKQSLSEQLFQLIASHDDCLDSIKIINKSLELYEKKIAISKQEIAKGEKKRIDHLKDLENYAEEKIKLTAAKNSLYNSWYQLELLTNIPLGALKDVCKNQNQ
ncbi:MAG: TolC family protein [Treponema sp.]|nr:TolC family protein [Candidatus Treponema scatequi]